MILDISQWFKVSRVFSKAVIREDAKDTGSWPHDT
jgi:hypothetical protein